MIHPKALQKLFSYNADLINKQTVNLTHEESLLQLPFEANCLNWVLGHIVSSRTLPMQLVGEDPVWTEEQRAGYRHGSTNPQGDESGIIRLEKIVEAFNLSQARLVEGLQRMSYEDMCRSSGYRENTVGDSLGYFQFHEAHHIGQILYLAQFAGKKGVWLL